MTDISSKKNASVTSHEPKPSAARSSIETAHSRTFPATTTASTQSGYTAQSGGTSEHGSQTQTLTLTEQVRQQLPTLILTLRNKHAEKLKGLSEKEQEAYIMQHINAFRDTLLRNIDQFQAVVKSARPSAASADQADYEEQKQMYGELLRVAIGLTGNMQKTLNEVLTRYRLLIEDLWEAICADKNPAPISGKFQQEIEAYMKETWDPVFAKADKMMDDIEKARAR
ncbi:unnamed protein product [Adineta steineri]|uniref:Uncharacterized protein n=1 Tax=Adineta steineri TaxID=433720 RepID=A0A814F187_9BILA|nr:unnamed protein product [Adineta steineri]